MTREGVVSSINSDDAELARHLNTEAAKSMKWGGLTEDEALSLVTSTPQSSFASTPELALSKPARTPTS